MAAQCNKNDDGTTNRFTQLIKRLNSYKEVCARYFNLPEIIKNSPIDSSCLDDDNFSF